ncbi:MAG: MATE family efflux transporter [Clostridia bacterium]|nr:MATE family efflux transporter [Clostridia bacterium]MBQ8720103.1 MATE family efflux transporter [Clostridia bacterium]
MILTKDKNFYKSLFLLSLPIALQNLVTFSIGLADNVMTGALGDAAISGVYMGGQIQTLLQVVSTGIEASILVIAAQYWGKRDTESIRRTVAIGMRFSLSISVIATLVCAIFPSFVISLFTKDAATIAAGAEYLSITAYSFIFFCTTQTLISAMRSVESPKIGLFVSLASLVINVSLNYVLIFGKLGLPALGVKGAAIATLIARIAELIITVVYVRLVDKKLLFRFRELLKVDRELTRDFIKYGTPIIAGQLVWAANVMTNSAIMGRLEGEGIVAAVSVTNTLHNLTYVVMNGMSSAVGIITGKTIGEGKSHLMREYAYTVQLLFLALGLLTGGVIQLLKSPFIALYNISAAAASHANSLINVISVTVVGTCYQAACLAGLVKSGGDISFVFKNDLIFVFFVVIPLSLVCMNLGLAPWIVFAALKCDQILKCFVAVVKINRFNWIKDLTRDTGHRNV